MMQQRGQRFLQWLQNFQKKARSNQKKDNWTCKETNKDVSPAPGRTPLLRGRGEGEYAEGLPVIPAIINRTLADVRQWVQETLVTRVRRRGSGLEHVDAVWIRKALPPPNHYRKGWLFAKIP